MSWPGSSPPTWGTRCQCVGHPRSARFIPTRVGNALRVTISGIKPPDHPPRVGNTSGSPGLHGGCSVHPHPHGEHISSSESIWLGLGSSPPAWGTHRVYNLAWGSDRFIPTRMGNTIAQILSTVRTSVHPHPHGEHCPVAGAGLSSLGSSPPAWGTHLDILIHGLLLRFIPTPMGNTGDLWSVGGPDHGSSPPAWGTLPLTNQGDDGRRFIPTRMGNTHCIDPGALRGTVHPPPHGEHTAELGAAFLCAGSSPPAWGTP